MATARKTSSRIGAERVRQTILSRINPIRGLTPDKLSRALDGFDAGHLRDATLVWDKIKERDDTILPTSEKRELNAAMLNWEITMQDDSPEAARHKEALEEFYNGITVTSAVDQNERGGVSMLLRHMMRSVGHRYAVHEIVWQPGASSLSAEFRFTPLQYFENTTGRLRLLPTEFSVTGEELEDGGWLVTVGAGLMKASSIAYLFKVLPLKDWQVYCEKAGIPGLHGKTDAQKGSPEWDNLRDALGNFVSDWAVITSQSASIEAIDIRGSGQLPHPGLVDRMDRAIARMWRGGDLGTMSATDGVGANPQEDETAILEAADAQNLSEALQYYVDRHVIKYRFGTEPLAYFQLQPRARLNLELQLKIDEALIKWGVPRAKKDLQALYGRPDPDDGEELASAPVAPAPMGFQNEAYALDSLRSRGRKEMFRVNAEKALSPEISAIVAPLGERLKRIADMDNPAEQRQALEAFKSDMPALFADAVRRVPTAAAQFEQILGAALVSGFAESSKPVLSASKS